MRSSLIQDFGRRVTLTRERIIKQIEEEKIASLQVPRTLSFKKPSNSAADYDSANVDNTVEIEEEEYCAICYTNVVIPVGKSIPPFDKTTIEFEC